ncbi:efflux RND transporter periplasmic adaptor subunit [Colwellia sp. M166]|jgi:membrane fusion protein (multidrug efflux system)|uniref:efflux RND transporter periplasmic adaptor subunit n=1 Tax=Colwellia sp. M166 TaxID=2583805 RepID=UPI00211EC8FF|nr:efflux RND transporter periplasmic adaptor subunit [Colwellia sp. M166]UUO23860.1 efflux RND transporter periplasmic adaptor subunit [Colwellia sp. M166]|tara:strand:- start:51518 stop:52693 length:1176 start_codon:yes stop_codon:yes gene_type:complete
MQFYRFGLLILSAIVGSVVLTGCDVVAEQATSSAPQATPVGVVTLKSQALTLKKELPGRVNAFQIAEIRPQVSGIVQSRLFVEGKQVEQGQALYQINPAVFEAELAASEAAVARAEASIASSKAKAARFSELLKIKAVSQQDFDEADAAYKQARAELLTAKAQLQSAKINLDYSHVSSPISGQISKSSVTVGALVSANQATALATVTQLDPIYIDLTQSSNELTQRKKALASGLLTVDPATQTDVELIMEDGSIYPHKGTLQFSEVTVNPSTGSVILRAEFPNPEKLLLPGMYARASIVEGVKADAILVPQRGVSRNSKGEPTALVVSAKSIVESRVLKIDRSVGANWLVIDGLKAGDRLIVEGLQKIRSGAPVTATEVDSSALSSTNKAQ